MTATRPTYVTTFTAGHVSFALSLIGLAIYGLVQHLLPPIWQPAPKWMPAPTFVAYACALLSLAAGVGLLVPRTTGVASRLLVVALSVWLVVTRIPNLFFDKPFVLVAWSWGAVAFVLGAALVIMTRANEISDDVRRRLVTIARTLAGLALIPFGFAHFLYVDATTVLIPSWLPAHTALAYATGACLVAAGVAMIANRVAALSAKLVTAEFALFGLIVWLPRVVANSLSAFQRNEVVTTIVLAAASLVMAESCASEGGVGER